MKYNFIFRDFPFAFIKPENFDYEGAIPSDAHFGLETLPKKKREELSQWLAEERASGRAWHFGKEMHAYCASDVFLLAKAMTEFEKEFEKTTWVNIFGETATAASAAMKVFRRK